MKKNHPGSQNLSQPSLLSLLPLLPHITAKLVIVIVPKTKKTFLQSSKKLSNVQKWSTYVGCDVDDSHCVQNPFLIVINEPWSLCWWFWRSPWSHESLIASSFRRQMAWEVRNPASSETTKKCVCICWEQCRKWKLECRVCFLLYTDQSAGLDRSASFMMLILSSVLNMSKSSVHTDSSHRVVRLTNSRSALLSISITMDTVF